MVLRIPSERFTAAVDDLSGLGEEESRQLETEDVTEVDYHRAPRRSRAAGGGGAGDTVGDRLPGRAAEQLERPQCLDRRTVDWPWPAVAVAGRAGRADRRRAVVEPAPPGATPGSRSGSRSPRGRPSSELSVSRGALLSVRAQEDAPLPTQGLRRDTSCTKSERYHPQWKAQKEPVARAAKAVCTITRTPYAIARSSTSNPAWWMSMGSVPAILVPSLIIAPGTCSR